MNINEAIHNKNSEAYFAAANGKHGFYSLYPEIFNEKDHKKVYILKGGPGTGKSTLLSKIAKEASAKGLITEIFLCSSDPRSLDGVSIPSLGISVIDGTSPHSQDPQFPGVCGEIINLGENWDAEKLKNSRGRAEELFALKSKAYERAYRYLSAAGTADDDITSGIRGAVNSVKSESMAKRLLLKISSSSGNSSKIKRRFVSAHSTVGRISLRTAEKLAHRLITVNYNYGAGVLFMNELCQMAVSGGYPIVMIPSALSPENTDGLIFRDTNTAVLLTTDDEVYRSGDLCINTKRFTDNNALAEIRGKQRFSTKAKENLICEAIDSLNEAGRIHDEIEKIYGEAMDFERIGKKSDELIRKIFD